MKCTVVALWRHCFWFLAGELNDLGLGNDNQLYRNVSLISRFFWHLMHEFQKCLTFDLSRNIDDVLFSTVHQICSGAAKHVNPGSLSTFCLTYVPGKKVVSFPDGYCGYLPRLAKCFGDSTCCFPSLARMTNLRTLTLVEFRTCSIRALTNIVDLNLVVTVWKHKLCLPPNLTRLRLDAVACHTSTSRKLRIVCPRRLQTFELTCCSVRNFDVCLNAKLQTWILSSYHPFVKVPRCASLRSFHLDYVEPWSIPVLWSSLEVLRLSVFPRKALEKWQPMETLKVLRIDQLVNDDCDPSNCDYETLHDDFDFNVLLNFPSLEEFITSFGRALSKQEFVSLMNALKLHTSLRSVMIGGRVYSRPS